MKGGEDYYRSSRDIHLGLGFEFLWEYMARGVALRRPSVPWPWGAWGRRFGLEKLCRAKTTNFWNITQQLQLQPNRHQHHEGL